MRNVLRYEHLESLSREKYEFRIFVRKSIKTRASQHAITSYYQFGVTLHLRKFLKQRFIELDHSQSENCNGVEVVKLLMLKGKASR